MRESITATATIDLTPLKKGQVECDVILHFGTLDQPEEISIVISGMSADQLNLLLQDNVKVGTLFGSPKIEGSTEYGVHFQTELVFFTGAEFGGDDTLVRCFIGPYSEMRPTPSKECAFWKFRLANFRLSGAGDVFNYQPPPFETVPDNKVDEYQSLIAEWHKHFGNPEMMLNQIKEKYKTFTVKGGVRRNRVSFTFAGRDWYLDDDLHGRWPKQLDSITQPIVSGTLSTAKQDGDSDALLKRIADDISDLLTFALSRDIKWISFGCFDEAGLNQGMEYRKPALLSFNQNGSRTIDNWELGNLKDFLEASEKVYVADRDWWFVSIGLLMQARGSKYLEVKCSLLNTLVDRVSSKVNCVNYGDEIDPKLDARLQRKWFRWLLHQLLRTLSKHWKQHRTDSLCDNVIKGWNAMPSFPNKVIRACDRLGIPPLSRTKIGFRHKLMHAGELDRKLKTIEKKVDYLFGLEAVVLMLMIRMLGFEGFIFLQSNPPDYKRVSEFLEENTTNGNGQ